MPQQELNEDIGRAFKQRKKRQVVFGIPCVTGIIFLVAFLDQARVSLGDIPALVIGFLCAAYLIGYAIFSLINWRCPACKVYLLKAINPNYCPKCGVRFQ